jgi:hypothetical protein
LPDWQGDANGRIELRRVRQANDLGPVKTELPLDGGKAVLDGGHGGTPSLDS